MLLRLPTRQVAALPVPGHPGVCMHWCFVRVMDLPTLSREWLRVNPREEKEDAIHRGIVATILNCAAMMQLKCAGIVFTCATCAYEGGAAVLEFTNTKLHGGIDGNNSRCAASNAAVKAAAINKDIASEYVLITCYSGLSATKVNAIAQCHNLHKLMKATTLDNYSGVYDGVKEGLGSDFADRIAWRESDASTLMPVQKLLQLMMAINSHVYPTRVWPAVYGAPSVQAKKFKEAILTEEPWAVALANSSRLALDANDMYDLLWEDCWAEVRETDGKPIKGRCQTASVTKHAPNAVRFQFLMALRANASWKPGNKAFRWRVPLARFFEGCGVELMRIIKRNYDPEPKRAADIVGKSASLAGELWDCAAAFVAEETKQ